MNNQIDPDSGLAINCRNCAHCDKSGLGADLDRCLKSGGNSCSMVQEYTLLFGHICRNYSSWAPRQKNIFDLIADRIKSLLS
jgi:hypothetical protein